MHLQTTLLSFCLIIGSEQNIDFHIRPYLQWPEGDAITVMWETTEPTIGEVSYGATPEMDLRAVEKEARRVHELRLVGLLPRTRYYYRVRCGGLTSPTFSFRTAPGHDVDRWRLIVYGDSRSVPERHQSVAELAARFEPDLLLHTGDLVARGSQRLLWKAQFFDPAADLFARVPVVTALGNHEEASANYFEYLALPGNEKYFRLDFANACIVVLDSNTWDTSNRDSEQARWLREELSRRRNTQWTLAAFHQPLFSAHDRRSINRARWNWSPLFEELGVKLILTGHDHFYFRSWLIGRLAEKPSRGITHITTAGGGAPLYPLKERSYTAAQRATYHCTVLDFTRDEIHGQAVDVDGNVFDKFKLTKDAPLPGEFCAFEVYELERAIRQEIESRPVTVVQDTANETVIDDSLRIPHTFRVPVRGRLTWQADGATADREDISVELKPGEPLVIPLKRRVRLLAEPNPGGKASPATLPRMKLQLADDRFRNREIEFAPLKLWRELAVKSRPVPRVPDAADMQKIDQAVAGGPYSLVRADGSGPAASPAQAYLMHTAEELVVVVKIHDSRTKVAEGKPAEVTGDSASLLRRQHIRLLLATPGQACSFLVTPDGRRSSVGVGNKAFDGQEWSAINWPLKEAWATMVTVPRRPLVTGGDLKINVVHFDPASGSEDCLSPTFDVGANPDRVPDFRVGDRTVSRFAKLIVE